MLDGVMFQRALQAKNMGKGRNSEYCGGSHEYSNNWNLFAYPFKVNFSSSLLTSLRIGKERNLGSISGK